MCAVVERVRIVFQCVAHLHVFKLFYYYSCWIKLKFFFHLRFSLLCAPRFCCECFFFVLCVRFVHKQDLKIEINEEQLYQQITVFCILCYNDNNNNGNNTGANNCRSCNCIFYPWCCCCWWCCCSPFLIRTARAFANAFASLNIYCCLPKSLCALFQL